MEILFILIGCYWASAWMLQEAVYIYQRIGIQTLIIENDWLPRKIEGVSEYSMDFGWGNGYVLVPIGHPLYRIDYDEISIEVHGGLTFSDYAKHLKGVPENQHNMWAIGFDTAHYQDTINRWPKEAVQKEADYLLQQVLNY